MFTSSLSSSLMVQVANSVATKASGSFVPTLSEKLSVSSGIASFVIDTKKSCVDPGTERARNPTGKSARPVKSPGTEGEKCTGVGFTFRTSANL